MVWAVGRSRSPEILGRPASSKRSAIVFRRFGAKGVGIRGRPWQ